MADPGIPALTPTRHLWRAAEQAILASGSAARCVLAFIDHRDAR